MFEVVVAELVVVVEFVTGVVLVVVISVVIGVATVGV